MSSSDHDDLPAQVSTGVRMPAHNAKGLEAADIPPSPSVAVSGSHGASDLAEADNPRILINALPTELLIMCIAALPFRDRIVATHVSRAWRADALAFPALWSDIDIPAVRSRNYLLLLALERSGTRPIDLRFQDEGGALEILEPHMHRVRRLTVHRFLEATRLRSPIPMLEYLELYGTILPADFLGGIPGRLQTLCLNRLESLPSVCPAVATVTSLSFGLRYCDTDGLPRLFDLFSSLRSLAITGLDKKYSAELRDLEPPRSLTKLTLEPWNDNTDILMLYDAWNHGQFREVELTAWLSEHKSMDLAWLLSRASIVTVELSYQMRAARIVTIGRQGRRALTIDDEGIDDDGMFASRINHFLDRLPPAEHLARVTSLTISVSVLGIPFSALAGQFPAVRDLTLLFEEEKQRLSLSRDWMVRYSWPWRALEDCAKALPAMGVRTLTVEWRPSGPDRPSGSYEDVRMLIVQHIIPLVTARTIPGFSAVRIQGIPLEVVDAFPLLVRSRIRFVAGTVVQPKLW
ncbi:hypothetical protein AURDEDRAFT_173095 [Auricularia subglabra TFB-10046 SS5]|nr:hypothetical protein AURDEDRAFT_173095 [Auricularia subglabra TFB-10046 SS5]